MTLSPRTAKWLAGIFSGSTLLLAVALGASWVYFLRVVRAGPAPEIKVEEIFRRGTGAKVSPLQVDYQLDLPGRGEIYPALAGGSPADYWPVAVLTITNSSESPLVQELTAEIPGWSLSWQRQLIVGPRQTARVQINPELRSEAFSVRELARATLRVTASSPNSAAAFRQNQPVLVHSISDLFWGKRFANAQQIARWVTPHDPAVLRLISAAREHIPRGRFAGYNDETRLSAKAHAQAVRGQARAVVNALRETGIGYVSSIFVFGNNTTQAQRIRFPSETLELSTANCIDVSVVFAAAMENIGMKPVIVIVPGHAFVGVRLGKQTTDTLYLDLTVLPKGTLEQAEQRAASWLNKTPPEQVITVDVAATRAMGIYPLSARPQTNLVVEAEPATEAPLPPAPAASSR